MAFNKMARWPVGYFRAFSKWLLNQRRAIPPRVATLTAEIDRIGFITVAYRGVAGEDGSVTMTEERVGISVPEGTTLARLLQAYIANGGNPFDISPFWMPGRTRVIGFTGDGSPIRVEAYPYGGLLSIMSANPGDPKPVVQTEADGTRVVIRSGFGNWPGGQVRSSEKNTAGRMGTSAPVSDHTIVKSMKKMRDWANQDISEQLNNIEWRIIKQMDLREQLEQERDVLLVQAFGNSLGGLPSMSTQRFNPSLTVQGLIQDMYEIIFEMDESTGSVKAYRAGPDLDFVDFAFEDLASEVGRDPLT